MIKVIKILAFSAVLLVMIMNVGILYECVVTPESLGQQAADDGLDGQFLRESFSARYLYALRRKIDWAQERYAIYADIFDFYGKECKGRLLGFKPVWRYTRQGFWIKLDLTDWPDKMFFFGMCEPETVKFIEALLRPGDMCFDIGASKGFYALQMAKRVGPGGSVFAFEPDSRVFDQLEANVKRNHFSNFKSEPLAVSDKAGKAMFTFATQSRWSSFFLNDARGHKTVTTKEVRLISIDEYFGQNDLRPRGDQILFFKVDVEGSEKRIFDGMKHVFADYEPVLLFEVNSELLVNAGTSADELANLVRAKGLELFVPYLKKTGDESRLKLRRIEPADTRPGCNFNVIAFRPTKPVLRRLRNILPDEPGLRLP